MIEGHAHGAKHVKSMEGRAKRSDGHAWRHEVRSQGKRGGGSSERGGSSGGASEWRWLVTRTASALRCITAECRLSYSILPPSSLPPSSPLPAPSSGSAAAAVAKQYSSIAHWTGECRGNRYCACLPVSSGLPFSCHAHPVQIVEKGKLCESANWQTRRISPMRGVYLICARGESGSRKAPPTRKGQGHMPSAQGQDYV